MAFHDVAFLFVFFPLFLLLERLLPSLRWKNRLLLLASLAFYSNILSWGCFCLVCQNRLSVP